MSGKNKVNPDHYKVAGRLSQDDLARARRSQSEPLFGATRSRQNKPLAPWMLKEQSTSQGADVAGAPGTAIDDGETGKPARAKAEPEPRKKAKTIKVAKRTPKTVKSARAAKAKSSTARKTATSRKTPKSRVSAAKKNTRSPARKSPRPAAKRTSRRSAKKAPRTAATSSTHAAKRRGAKKKKTR